MIGYSKKNRENYPRECFDKKKKKPGFKFNPGLALTGVRTTGPRIIKINHAHNLHVKMLDSALPLLKFVRERTHIVYEITLLKRF